MLQAIVDTKSLIFDNLITKNKTIDDENIKNFTVIQRKSKIKLIKILKSQTVLWGI